MTCPSSNVLSQWVDGVLDAREAASVARHAERCAECLAKSEELRAVGVWISSAAVSGPACLSADDMASALESGRIPPHARTCPSCAAELRALKPQKESRRATRRRERPEAPLRAWAVAAAVFVAVGVLLAIAVSQNTPPTVEFAYRPPTPLDREPVMPGPPLNALAPKPVAAPVPAPATPALPAPEPTPRGPSPTPEVPPALVPDPPPKTELPSPTVHEPVRETVTTALPRVAAALSIKSGALSALTVDGKWAKPGRIEDGMTLRAEGRATVEFAQARVTLDGLSRFSVSQEEFALLEGGLSAEVSASGPFVLVLEDQRFFPQTQNARVLLCAKPDRLLVDEGSATWKGAFLHEGTEYGVKKGSVEAKKGRSLPAAAARAREQLTWRLDLSNASLVKKNVVGRVDNSPEGRLLASEPMKDGSPFYGTLSYNNGGEAAPVFTVKPNTAIRFRYYLREPGHLELVMWSGTKQENFNKVLEPVVRQWTTMTVYARDVAANRGGKPVTCEVGDKYTSIGLFVGTAGMPTEVHLDRLEILEVDR